MQDIFSQISDAAISDMQKLTKGMTVSIDGGQLFKDMNELSELGLPSKYGAAIDKMRLIIEGVMVDRISVQNLDNQIIITRRF